MQFLCFGLIPRKPETPVPRKRLIKKMFLFDHQSDGRWHKDQIFDFFIKSSNHL